MISHVEPSYFEDVGHRKLPRIQRQAIERAYELDCVFFRENAARVTRIRRVLEGEMGTTDFFEGEQCFAVVRQLHPGEHLKLFCFAPHHLAEVMTSEETSCGLYYGLLMGQRRELTTTRNRKALSELLAILRVQGEA